MPDAVSIRKQMCDDHERLNRLFSELLDAVEGADAPTISRTWTEFETGLLAHFDAEESQVFPLLSADHAAEVEVAQRQHAHIRRLVADLGVRADLQTIRLDIAQELITKLREHAHYEDVTVYGWAEEVVASEQRASMLQQLLSRRSA